jgi:hypothetical protein
MGNTSIKSCRAMKHKHRGTHKHRNTHKHRRFHRRGGTSPLNPSHVSGTSPTRKTRKRDDYNLRKELLKYNARKSTGLYSPIKTRKSPPRRKTPVKRNFVVSEETIMEEEEPEVKSRRKSF